MHGCWLGARCSAAVAVTVAVAARWRILARADSSHEARFVTPREARGHSPRRPLGPPLRPVALGLGAGSILAQGSSTRFD